MIRETCLNLCATSGRCLLSQNNTGERPWRSSQWTFHAWLRAQPTRTLRLAVAKNNCFVGGQRKGILGTLRTAAASRNVSVRVAASLPGTAPLSTFDYGRPLVPLSRMSVSRAYLSTANFLLLLLVFQTSYGWESAAGQLATCRLTLRAG